MAYILSNAPFYDEPVIRIWRHISGFRLEESHETDFRLYRSRSKERRLFPEI